MKTPDRRVQRTRRTLREALLLLTYEKGWEQTSVQDICARADVGRSTFYAHFADKEELLTSGFDDLRSALRAQVGQGDEALRPPLAYANALLEHLDQNRRLHRALLGERTALVVQKHFRRLLLEFVAEDLAPLVPDVRRRDLAVRYVAGGLYELLIWWVDARVPETLATVATAMREFTRPVVDAANAPVPQAEASGAPAPSCR
ncbi:MAG: TetR/AcrR family transcriptional regulator [Pseudomonadota bacterium]|nr:TetR/AcrR family transcriptional regulator [Pseudomonadota bacterium]